MRIGKYSAPTHRASGRVFVVFPKKRVSFFRDMITAEAEKRGRVKKFGGRKLSAVISVEAETY